MKSRIFAMSLIAVAVAAVGFTAFSQQGGDPGGEPEGTYDLTWHTIDGGGGSSTGGEYALTGTVGQPDAGVMSNATYVLRGGFWAGAEVIPVPTCPADIAPTGGDGLVNVSDLLMVINNWGPCPAPPNPCPADIAPHPGGDGVVNVSDLLMIINNWGACP